MHVHGQAGSGHGEPGIPSAAGRNQRRLILVLGLTTLYMGAEVVGALLTGSLALLADASHMLTDILGVAMALGAIWLGRRPATAAKTYGFYRTEILAALVNAVVLFGIAAYILYEAWQRFTGPVPPEIDSVPMLLVAVGGVLVNIASAWLLRAGADESLNIRGAFLEVVADLISSIGVIVAAAIIYFTGWWQADAVVSLLIGVFILPRTWHLLKSALDVLLEATPSHIDVTDVQHAMQQVPGVRSVHDVHVWTITSGFVAMSGHVQSADRPSEDVLHDLQTVLREDFQIQHLTLQVEQGDHGEDGACCSMDPRCLVIGEGAQNVIGAHSR